MLVDQTDSFNGLSENTETNDIVGFTYALINSVDAVTQLSISKYFTFDCTILLVFWYFWSIIIHRYRRYRFYI